MFGLNDMKENKTCVEQHIQFSVQDILIKWKELPKYMGFAHIPLLQAAQLVSFIIIDLIIRNVEIHYYIILCR